MGRTIVIQPGGYHPFHAGHYALYQSAQRAFPGAEVFVAATNDTSSRPFPFAVKEKLAKLAGVEPGHFVQVKSPFRAEEITSLFDPARDRLIFVRSEKDAAKPPQPGGIKKDGSAAYLQPLAGQKNIRPFKEHAYMAYLPTVEFGPGMTSATEIRTAWPTLNEKRKTALVMSLYPQTQSNPALAANVVKMLDAAIGTQDITESAKKCPPATQNITLNLANRQKAIDEYGYGPLNPDMPNNQFWMKKVNEWNLDSMEEAQQSLCGNCAAFDIRQETLDCIAQGIDSDSPEDAEGVIDAGELGYCKFLKFKCASRRTCDAWVTGGPLQDKPIDENLGGAILGGVAGAALTKTPSGAITGARLGGGVQDLITKENQDQSKPSRRQAAGDAELTQVKAFARTHYPGMAADPDTAFDKWIQRSLMHSSADDKHQDTDIARLAKEISLVKSKLQTLQKSIDSSDYLDE